MTNEAFAKRHQRIIINQSNCRIEALPRKCCETATHRVLEKYVITNHYPRLSVFECAVPDDARLVAWRTTEQAILQQVAHLTPLVADVH